MCIGDYVPKVGEKFIFTPNPDKLNGLNETVLFAAGQIFTIVEVENRAVTQYPYSVLYEGETMCLSPSELSFLVVKAHSMEYWL